MGLEHSSFPPLSSFAKRWSGFCVGQLFTIVHHSDHSHVLDSRVLSDLKYSVNILILQMDYKKNTVSSQTFTQPVPLSPSTPSGLRNVPFSGSLSLCFQAQIRNSEMPLFQAVCPVVPKHSFGTPKCPFFRQPVPLSPSTA
ncbi:hypothetical protein AVEN_147366-1 [Araneus ventricosus]|uniref:Uncharacterized protein n=1 Tax=Araneus ventricosus TaxID=182803 RepID=A0A4Y2WWV5_ARAVE|nr:hypothetical protein AVEN_147366-1 [Araneus ventricosus]